MIETMRAWLALILCFATATTPLQAPALGISSPESNRFSVLDRGSASPRAGTIANPKLEQYLDPARMLKAGRTMPFEIAELGAYPNDRQAEFQSYSGQTSTLLADGRLLLLGGRNGTRAIATAFIKDSKTGAITQLSQRMQHARYGHSATVLPDGTVLILGGIGNDGNVQTVAEVFNPSSLTFSSIAISGITSRAFHTSTLLIDGRVLIAGGLSANGQIVGLLELWDWKAKTRAPSGSEMKVARGGHTATLQADGSVLFWGGIDSNGTTLDYGEVYDPTSQSVRIETTPPAPDSTGSPVVDASIPQDGDQNVLLNTLIAVRFSRPMEIETVNANTITLSSSYTNLQAKIVPAEGGMLAFVIATGGLTSGTTYTVTLSGETDRAGTPLGNTSISFTTAGGDSNGNQPVVNEETNANVNSNPFDSPWRKLPSLQAPPGVTAVSGQTLKLNGEPLANVTFQIGKIKTHSDRTGRFLLQHIPDGHQAMWIEGRTANTRSAVYGSYEVGVDVKKGKTHVLRYTIWMTPLDMAHAVTITSPTVGETIITTPTLPGLELHVPAGTVINDHYDKIVTQVSITPVPIAQPPFPLPRGVPVPIYFTIQPGGAYLEAYGKKKEDRSKGARLFYPNPHHYPPGTDFNFWNYDADKWNGWYVYGQGIVSADASQVVPNPGVVIYEFTGAMVGNPPTPAQAPLPGSGPQKGGEPVDLQTGLFVYTKTDLSLPDVIPIQISRTYRQMDPTSRGFGIGTTLNYDTFLTGDAKPYTYIDLILGDGGRIHFDRVSGGTDYTNVVYEHTTSPTSFYGAQIVYSNGWLLTLKDGTKYQYPDCFLDQVPQKCAPLSMSDRNGNTVAFTRDPNSGDLTQITSPNGRWIQLTYDSSDRVTQAADNSGRSVLYNYDGAGRLSTVQDVNGGTTTYGYDSNNNMTTIQDARQIVYLTNYYDANNMVYKQALADGSTYQFSYVGANVNGICSIPCPISGSGVTQASVTDPRQNVRQVSFNSDGYMSSQTYGVGTSVQQTSTYNREAGSGLILSTTDALNRQTNFTYDAMANVTSVTTLAGTPNAAATSFTYQPAFSELGSVTDPLGRTASFSYDQVGNLLRATDPSGIMVSASYDAQGRPVSISDPAGNTYQLSYSGGDLTGLTDPLGRNAAAVTDEVGRPLVVTDPTGQTTQFTYNPFNLITSVIDPRGNTTNIGWDPNGHLLSVQDANRHTTSYTYDNLDRPATRTDPLLVQESFRYDGNDNLTQYTDRRGTVTTYSYDALNRLSFIGFGTQPGPTYQSTINVNYDIGDRPSSVVDSIAGTITPTFDGLDRLTSEATPQGSVGYQYDAVGRRTTMTVAGQSAVNYTYDNSDRLTQITQGTSVVGFGYDADGRRTSLTLPNGVSLAYSYDQASRLAAITYQTSAGMLGNLGYAYDQAGRVAQLSGSFARTGLPAPLSSATYDAANRLTNWGGTAFAYDANGNLTNDGVNTYSWDARNQLASISGNVSATFQYDAYGRRIGKTINGVSTGFLYDAFNAVQELSGSTPTANLLTGGGDEIFTRTTTGVENYLTDPLGSTIAITDSTGTLATQYTYEPFGNTSSTGTATSNSFQYTGRENDGTGLYFNRARYYSPRLQRFISQDPIGFGGGSTNLYSYAFNSPTNFTDTTGRGPEAVLPIAAEICEVYPLLCVATAALAAYYAYKALPGAPSIPVSTPMDPGRAPSNDPGKKNRCQELNDAVQAAKGVASSLGKCTPGMSTWQLQIRYDAFVALGAARAQRDEVCFNGGDDGHQQAQAAAWAAAGNCAALLAAP